jgi:hypothetical protein
VKKNYSRESRCSASVEVSWDRGVGMVWYGLPRSQSQFQYTTKSSQQPNILERSVASF